MCRIFIETPAGSIDDGQGIGAFDPSMLMRPAFAEYWSRARKLPRQMGRTLWQYATSGRGRGPAGILGAAENLLQLFPTGLFSNEPLRRYLADIFNAPGRTDDFRKLSSRLYLIATDLDSGQAVEFGAAGHDDIPISVAATASSALPGLFPPVEIAGRHYVDGALKRTLHASVALKEGADLVICLNPLVPYDDSAVIESGAIPRRLIDGGLPIVVLQTIRAVIRSRMEIGMRQYGDDFPRADVVLFEPDRADAEMFFTNIFSYSSRRRMCEHAYQKTRSDIWKRRHQLQPLLSPHGVTLNLDILRDRSRSLVTGVESAVQPRLVKLGGVVSHLSESLSDLERYLRHAEARAPKT
jgi:predicted acylesterase/phospholipase RssA